MAASEGDVLERARKIVGPDCVIGVLLDLHCIITEKITLNSDVIITFKEYPHTDTAKRAEELFSICRRVVVGEVKPVIEVFDCRMISMWYTSLEPMRGVIREMQEHENRDGILSVSFAHGFPWCDVPDAGAKTIVIADRDRSHARALAEHFGRRIWRLRDQTAPKPISIEAALSAIEKGGGAPLVLADVSDNPGGGAPSDSTFLLRALIERGFNDVVCGFYWDPLAVRLCREAGEGARITLRVGGKCGPSSGDPVDLNLRVMRIVEDAGQTFGETRRRLGTAVWVRSNSGLDIVLTTLRVQVLHPDGFYQLGIQLDNKRAIVVKSIQHFVAGFRDIAGEILYVDSPGALRQEFESIPYQNFKARYWPRVANPFPLVEPP